MTRHPLSQKAVAAGRNAWNGTKSLDEAFDNFLDAAFEQSRAEGNASEQELFQVPNTIGGYRTTPPYGQYESVLVTIIKHEVKP